MTDWLRLADPEVELEPTAHERLLEAAESMPRAVLLASKVVLKGGELDPGSLPIPETLDPDLDAEACARGQLAVRAVRPGYVLVRREAAGTPPTGRRGFLAWSAGVLRRGPGLMVPASVAVRSEPAPDNLRELARLLTGGSLAAREKPWFAFHLAERAAGTLRT